MNSTTVSMAIPNGTDTGKIEGDQLVPNFDSIPVINLSGIPDPPSDEEGVIDNEREWL